MSIDLIKLTDTFNTFMDLVNRIINKINQIEIDSSTVKLKFSTSNPANDDLKTSEAILYLDTTGRLKLKPKFANDTIETNFVTSSDTY